MSRRKWFWAALIAAPLAVSGGLVYANSQKATEYTCPITGEQLPCSDCCPLNGQQVTDTKNEDRVEGYICPITGETLGCEGCCPLNQSN